VVVDGTGAVIVTELLFARITGDRRPTQRVVLPTRLVPRGSGERTP
jgi:LacI family transcriptional regulator